MLSLSNKRFLLVINSPFHFLCRMQISWTRRLEKSHSCKWHITSDLSGNRQESSFSDPCTWNRERGQSSSAPLYVLTEDKEESQSTYSGNDRITPSMKHLKTITVILPYSPELALKFQRQQGLFPRATFPSVPCMMGNLLTVLLPSGTRLPWTSELLWPSLRVDKQLHTQPGPAPRKIL